MEKLICSIYENAWDDTSTQYVPVLSVLKAIKSGRWKEQIEEIRGIKDDNLRNKYKMKIPGVCFQGTFEKKRVYIPKKAKHVWKSRFDDHIVHYSGIVVADIDTKDVRTIQRLKSALVEDPYVFAYFLSPSGGLKILYVVDSAVEFHKKYAYEQIKGWVEDNYDIEVDKSGKNLSRLCYVSYDPDLYINEEYLVFTIDTEKALDEEFQSMRHVSDASNTHLETNLDEIYKVCKNWLAKDNQFYMEGNRNEYIHRAACILNRAGLSYDQIMLCLTSNHSISRKMYDEAKTTVQGVSTRNRFEFGAKPIYGKRRNNNQNSFFE